MKKLNAILVITAVLFLFISCKKDKTIPAFSATGFWRGNFPVDLHTILGMINHPDGTSRYYLMGNLFDTAYALVKYDGTYIVNGDLFRAEYHLDSTGFKDTLSLDGISTSTNSMSGIIVEHGVSGTTYFEGTYNFGLIKQQ